jgi:anti-sigma factor RsiW
MSRLRRTPRDIACRELVERITEYFEGALSAGAQRAIEHHLAECEGCAAYVQQMRETRRLAGALRAEDVPPAGVDALLAAFRAQHSNDA